MPIYTKTSKYSAGEVTMNISRSGNVPVARTRKLADARNILVRQMRSFLRRRIRQPKNIALGHDFSHHQNSTRAAKWYLEKIGALNPHTSVQAEIATAMYDSMKNEPNHGESAAKVAVELMNAHGVHPGDVSAVKNAILLHNRARLKSEWKESDEDRLADALYFANRINCIGSYGVFRCAAGLFDEPRRLRLFNTERKKSHEAAKQLRRKLFIEDLNLQIRVSVDYLDIGNQQIESRKYYPQEVFYVLEAYAKETARFVTALEKNRPWAVEIADKFLGLAGKPQRQTLNMLIQGFTPKTPEASTFKNRAIDFIQGEIEQRTQKDWRQRKFPH